MDALSAFENFEAESAGWQNLGLCHLVLSEMGDNLRASRKNKKNSSQKNTGAFAVTTGLPKRPHIAMETVHFFFCGAGT